jgi:hypothetical protein
MESNIVNDVYAGIVWFIILSLIWFSILNTIKSYKSKIFFGIFGVVLLLLAIVSAIRIAEPSRPVYSFFGGRFSGIGSLIAHVIFAIYSFYTAFSSSPLNTNQRLVLVSPPANKAVQSAGRRRR